MSHESAPTVADPTRRELDVLLESLARKHVDLWIDGDRVAIEDPNRATTEEESARVERWNSHLLEHMQQPGCILRSAPLSLEQQGLLYLHQAMPESVAYHTAFPIRIHSQVDVKALADALQDLVNRHAPLRTVFEIRRRGGPRQHVLGFKEFTLEHVECSGVTDEEFDRLIYSRHAEPFDVEHDLPVRAHLFTRNPSDHVFLMTVHHLVNDAFSMWRLMADLEAGYVAAVAGTAPKRRALGAAFTEFVAWEQQALAGPEGREHVAFWEEYLAGAPALLDIPSDHERPPLPTSRGDLIVFQLPEDLLGALQRFSDRRGLKPLTVTLGAFQILLHRYSGQDDVLIAFETSGRPALRFARSTGCFVNPVVFRSRLDETVSCVEFLDQQEREMTSVLAHQVTPFVYLAEHLTFDRDPRYLPLVQVEFNLLRSRKTARFESLFVPDGRRVDYGGMTVSAYPLLQQVGQYDLSLSASDVDDEFWCGLKYNTDLFSADQSATMVEHYKVILAALVNQPEAAVSSISLVTPAEQQRILAEATPETPLPDWVSVATLFAVQVDRSPDTTAVVCGGSRLSYRELDTRANQLAGRLRDLGVGRDHLVGVCLGRSIDMVVAVLAVIKTGAAYLPLDPDLPERRLRFMIEDSGVSVLVTESVLAGSLPEVGARTVLVDATHPAAESMQDRTPATELQPDEVAYVVYTSGSTGTPKGVELTHRGLTNLLLSAASRLKITEDDSLLAVTTFAFDIATMELLLPLVVGATVVIASDEDTKDGRRIAELIRRHDSTFMQATPATWRLLLGAGWQGQPAMTALSGGEVLTPALAEALSERVASVWNGYGPSEATIYATFHEVQPGDSPIPIGTRVANTATYVLDDQLELVPRGLIGELYLGGIGLARGYLNRAALTADRFLPDPFSPDPGARMYRTGDRVRVRGDGELEYLGRNDHQVKLRGFRIELGEIEVALERHPLVKQAVALTTTDTRGHTRLVAGVVPEDAPPTMAELKEHLRKDLPDYMIPAAVLPVDQFPLTSTGKVDRRAVADLAQSHDESDRVVEEPSSDVERDIGGLWRTLLGVQHVDANDRFSDVGGDSITLAEMVVQLSERYDIELPLRVAIEHPTVRSLARAVEAARLEQTKTGPSPQPTGPNDPSSRRWNRRRRSQRAIFRSTILGVLRLFVRATARVTVEGEDRIPDDGALVLASNHMNWFDFPLFASALSQTKLAARTRSGFVVAHRWKKLFHHVFTQLGEPIYVRRGMGDLDALDAARRMLLDGRLVGIAPEGTFDHGELIRAKSGAVRMAAATDSPILPVAIYGQGQALRSWRHLRRVSVCVRFGEPITIDPASATQLAWDHETDRVMMAIAGLLPPDLRGVYGSDMKQHP